MITDYYFLGCESEDDVKKEYRRLCKFLHPDKGGKAEDFVEMKKQYDGLIKAFVWKKKHGDGSRVKIKTPKKKPVTFDELKKDVFRKKAKEFAKKNFSKQSVKFKMNNDVYIVDVDEMIDGLVNIFFR